MKNCLLLVLLMAACTSPSEETTQPPAEAPTPLIQPDQLSFDHRAFIVRNLDTAVAFYHDVLGLEEIYDATGKDHIRWFDLGNDMAMHIIESPDAESIVTTKSVHLCLTVKNYTDFLDRLSSHGITYEDWPGQKDTFNLRPDGVRQIYFQDPDGYWLEVNDAIAVRAAGEE